MLPFAHSMGDTFGSPAHTMVSRLRGASSLHTNVQALCKLLQPTSNWKRCSRDGDQWMNATDTTLLRY